jgi:hypothetical protein
MTGSQGSQQVNLADEADDAAGPIDNRGSGRMVFDEISPDGGCILIEPEPYTIGWSNLTDCFQSLCRDPWHSHSASSSLHEIDQMNKSSHHRTLPAPYSPSGCDSVTCRHSEDVSLLEVNALQQRRPEREAQRHKDSGSGPPTKG